MTNAEFVKRMTEISEEIYLHTAKNPKPYLFGYPPTVEIKTYWDDDDGRI